MRSLLCPGQAVQLSHRERAGNIRKVAVGCTSYHLTDFMNMKPHIPITAYSRLSFRLVCFPLVSKVPMIRDLGCDFSPHFVCSGRLLPEVLVLLEAIIIVSSE